MLSDSPIAVDVFVGQRAPVPRLGNEGVRRRAGAGGAGAAGGGGLQGAPCKKEILHDSETFNVEQADQVQKMVRSS